MTARATALMRAPARRNVSISAASLRIRAASTSRSAGMSAPAPARRDGVSRNDSVSASCRLTVRCADSNPTREQSTLRRNAASVASYVGSTLTSRSPGQPGATRALDLGHVAPVGDEHDLVAREDGDGGAAGESGQEADVGEVKDDEGLEPLAGQPGANTRLPGRQKDRGWLGHGERENPSHRRGCQAGVPYRRERRSVRWPGATAPGRPASAGRLAPRAASQAGRRRFGGWGRLRPSPRAAGPGRLARWSDPDWPCRRRTGTARGPPGAHPSCRWTSARPRMALRVVRGHPQDVAQLPFRGFDVADLEQGAPEGHPGRQVARVPGEAGPADLDGFLEAAGAAVLLRQLGEGDGPRVLLDPLLQRLDARVVRHADILLLGAALRHFDFLRERRGCTERVLHRQRDDECLVRRRTGAVELVRRA